MNHFEGEHYGGGGRGCPLTAENLIDDDEAFNALLNGDVIEEQPPPPPPKKQGFRYI